MQWRRRPVTPARSFSLLLFFIVGQVFGLITSLTATENHHGSLTTTFTAKPDCWGTVYALDQNTIPTAVTRFLACADSLSTAVCCPQGYKRSGYYSPGLCLDEYAPHTKALSSEIITTQCCPSGMSTEGPSCTNSQFNFELPAITIRNNLEEASSSTTSLNREGPSYISRSLIFGLALGLSCFLLFVVLGLLLLHIRQRRSMWRVSSDSILLGRVNQASSGGEAERMAESETQYKGVASNSPDESFTPHSPDDYWKLAPDDLETHLKPLPEPPIRAHITSSIYEDIDTELSFSELDISEQIPTKPLTIQKPKFPPKAYMIKPQAQASSIDIACAASAIKASRNSGTLSSKPPPKALSIKTTNLPRAGGPQTPARVAIEFTPNSPPEHDPTPYNHRYRWEAKTKVVPLTPLLPSSSTDDDREELDDLLKEVRLVREDIILKAADDLREAREKEARLMQRRRYLMMLRE